MFTYRHPTKVVFGRGALEKLGEEAAALGKKALVVTGRNFAKKHGYLDRIGGLLRKAGVEPVFFPEVEPNPSLETVDRGAEVARREGVDLYVAFGGGSAMDAAKAIDVVATLGGRAADWVYPKVVEEKVKPIIALPTTHGTGSEVTKYSVLTDTGRGVKTVVVGDGILPDVALLDPEPLKHLPAEQAAATGLDALSHAVEAYFSRKATPLSDLFALEAARLVFANLPCAVRGSLECRTEMLYASMLAGYAINVAGTNIGHGLGYEITVRKGVPHGFANLLILPHAAGIYAFAAPDKMDELLDRLGIYGLPGGLKEALEVLKKTVGAPMTLRDVGFTEKDIDYLVEKAALYKRNLANAPIELSEDDIRGIYESALG